MRQLDEEMEKEVCVDNPSDLSEIDAAAVVQEADNVVAESESSEDMAASKSIPELIGPREDEEVTETEATEIPETTITQKKLFSSPCGFWKPLNWKELKKKAVQHKRITAAVVLGLIMVITAVCVLCKPSSGYMVLSEDDYLLLSDLNPESAVYVASENSDAAMEGLVRFSPDGKDVYYLTKYDEDANSGSLYHIQRKKITKNPLRNGGFIQLVDTRVEPGFRVMEDGTLLYTRHDGDMYGYKNGSSEIINYGVDGYDFDEDNRLIYRKDDSLYGASADNLSHMQLAVIDYIDICPTSEDRYDQFLFTKMVDGSVNLYAANFEGANEQLAEKADILTQDRTKIFFTQHNGTYLNLYDYVTDDCEKEDMALKEPKKEDYCDPIYRYRKISADKLKEEDFPELYTSCSLDLHMYGINSYWDYAMEDASWMYWGNNNAAIQEATQSFMEKYADQEDKNGLIKVTEEVKADLHKIREAFGQKEEWTWMWLCYEKYVYDEQLNEKEYNAAVQAWEDAQFRIQLRKELRDLDNAYPVKTLCCYDSGTITTVAENVLDANVLGNMILHNDTSFEIKPLKIKSVGSVEAARNLFALDYNKQNYVVSAQTGACSQLSKGALSTIRMVEKGEYDLYMNDDHVYAFRGDGKTGTLLEATVLEGVVESFSSVCRYADVQAVDDSKLYYYSNIYENQDKAYCDLYVYENGSSKCLARDILHDIVVMYEDGKLLAYTGYDKYSGYQVAVIGKDGTLTVLGDSISTVFRSGNAEILYISEGNLYCCRSGKKEMLQEDVRYFWCSNAPEPTHILGSMNHKLSIDWDDYFGDAIAEELIEELLEAFNK